MIFFVATGHRVDTIHQNGIPDLDEWYEWIMITTPVLFMSYLTYFQGIRPTKVEILYCCPFSFTNLDITVIDLQNNNILKYIIWVESKLRSVDHAYQGLGFENYL